MKEVERYRWRVKWLGKWTTTNYYATEEDIRKTHPEAVRLDFSKEVRLLPETEEEMWKTMRGTVAGPMEASPRFHPDGRRKMGWEK